MGKLKQMLRPWLDWLHLHGLYTWLRENMTLREVIVCRFRYARHIRRLRKSKGAKLRVLFIVSEIAKWKEQKIYEAMKSSDDFEPIIGLSAWNRQRRLSASELNLVHEKAEVFFKKLGDRTVRTVNVECGRKVYCDLRSFNPDIVYYTEPWGPCEKQDPYTVSKFAITAYTPYFVPNYGVMSLDCHQFVHRLIYAYFTLNEAWCRAYRRSLRFVAHSAKFVPTGHPTLDYFANAPNMPPGGDKVIYAPHFSFFNPNSPDYTQRYSTFDKNRNEILEYAKRHREFNWVFKPHPVLREWVHLSGLMTQKELDAYFEEWAKIGEVCEDGDYHGLFLASRAIITDCGSFLTEYGSTGRPVIHLICAENTYTMTPLIEKLYATYYRVHNFGEMYETFKLVLEDRKDPLREIRLEEARKAGILNSNAANSIVSFLAHELARI